MVVFISIGLHELGGIRRKQDLKKNVDSGIQTTNFQLTKRMPF